MVYLLFSGTLEYDRLMIKMRHQAFKDGLFLDEEKFLTFEAFGRRAYTMKSLAICPYEDHNFRQIKLDSVARAFEKR